MTLSSYALAFWAGAQFIEAATMGRQDLLRCFLAVTLTAQAIGRITSLAPDSGKATAAARNVFKVFDEDAAAAPAPAAGEGGAAKGSALARIDPLDEKQGRRSVAPEGAVVVAAAAAGKPAQGGLHGRLEFRDVT